MMHSDPDGTRDDESLAPAGYIECEYTPACKNLTNKVWLRFITGEWVPTCRKCADADGIEDELIAMNLDAGKRLFEQFASEQRADDWPL